MSGNEGEHPPEEKAAGMARRSCTDPICFAVFVAYCVGMGFIIATSMAEGNLKRLTHGFDFQGRLCGVDENVTAQPYLYWCEISGSLATGGAIPVSLNLREPICVSECPTGPESPQQYCPMPSSTEVTFEGQGQAQTRTTVIVSRVVPQIPYKTKLIGNSYCVPHVENAPQLAASLLEGQGAPLGNWMTQFMQILGSVKRAWRVFIGAAVVAVILSYIYLFLLNKFAKVLVYVAMFLLVTVCVLLGLAMLSTAWNMTGHQADSPIFQRYPHDEAVKYSQIAGSVALAIGALFICVIMCAHGSIDMACGCVESACECMFDMPSLLGQPLTATLVKLALSAVLSVGFMFLASCGTVSNHSATIGGQEINGLKRSFHYTQEQQYMFLYYIFGFFWTLELCNAMNQFIVSYAVVLWYYKPKQGSSKGSPRIPVVRGFLAGATFHLGSLAFGASLIAMVQMVRAALATIQASSKADGNQAMACIAGVCGCFMACFEKCLKFITKNAYIDIAIHSNSFIPAAIHSFEFISGSGSAIAILNGACFIFSVVGALLVSVLSGVATYVMVTSCERYTKNDSPHWVEDPTAVAILAGILALGIGVCFMLIFEQCADTLLYTYQDNKTNNPDTVANFAPDNLAALVAGGGAAKGKYEPLPQQS